MLLVLTLFILLAADPSPLCYSLWTQWFSRQMSLRLVDDETHPLCWLWRNQKGTESSLQKKTLRLNYTLGSSYWLKWDMLTYIDWNAATRVSNVSLMFLRTVNKTVTILGNAAGVDVQSAVLSLRRIWSVLPKHMLHPPGVCNSRPSLTPSPLDVVFMSKSYP